LKFLFYTIFYFLYYFFYSINPLCILFSFFYDYLFYSINYFSILSSFFYTIFYFLLYIFCSVNFSPYHLFYSIYFFCILEIQILYYHWNMYLNEVNPLKILILSHTKGKWKRPHLGSDSAKSSFRQPRKHYSLQK